MAHTNNGWLVARMRDGYFSMYLEYVPYEKAFRYIAMGPKHATPLTKERAQELADADPEKRSVIHEDDYYDRVPKEL